MGFFSKLFGGKKDKPKSHQPKAVQAKPNNQTRRNQTNKNQNFFLTNAADFGLGDIQLGISGKLRVDGILAFAEMEKIAKARNQPFEFQVLYTTLLEEGALTAPVVCSIGEDKYTLYFIYQEEELLKYKDLVKQVGRTAYPNLIYFSAIPIYDGYTPKPIIEPFQLADLRVDKGAKIEGPYAMWWKTDEDPVFHKSKTFEHLNKMYQVFQGYETYMTGYVLRQTRVKQEAKLERMRLPEQHASYIIAAPEGKHVILDLSQEKGIRFMFPMNNTTAAYRERFLKGVLVDFLATRLPLQQQNAPKDEPTDPNGFDWFNFMSRVIKKQEEEGASIDQIGGMNFDKQVN